MHSCKLCISGIKKLYKSDIKTLKSNIKASNGDIKSKITTSVNLYINHN